MEGYGGARCEAACEVEGERHSDAAGGEEEDA